MSHAEESDGLLLVAEAPDDNWLLRSSTRRCAVPVSVLLLCSCAAGVVLAAFSPVRIWGKVHVDEAIGLSSADRDDWHPTPQDVSCTVEDSPDTEMGEMPEDGGGTRQATCEKSGGKFLKFPVYTDPMHYYTAGFKCCHKLISDDTEEPPPFDPATCTFISSCETKIGEQPVDEGGHAQAQCHRETHTFIPFMTYAEPSHYYCAGFKCCLNGDAPPNPDGASEHVTDDLDPLPEVDSNVECTVEDSPDTPMGEMPVDKDGKRQKECEADGGELIKFEVYTDPNNYYTAGFKCCKPEKEQEAPFNDEDCKFFVSEDTEIGDAPVDKEGHFKASCDQRTHVFVPFEHYTEPYVYYVAGFKCCKKV